MVLLDITSLGLVICPQKPFLYWSNYLLKSYKMFSLKFTEKFSLISVVLSSDNDTVIRKRLGEHNRGLITLRL